ncbi:helix-turn-helix domain-containing protein [Vagococcus vulneris]|uniref:Transcriptional regulator n=1 Tax=Vagococcus vulneris TaxID=1977869 RepID=A0A430A1L1_9ENTE|nr:helix-turn-helix transcriptional regulator [Vagococcus vulneris]RSU00288.1 transcriptional regulator [Vagococcus vulneris]
MNIEKFIEARRKNGLSQIELAEGICTQATLSRFENNGQVPSLKILLKLCERLNISLGELFPKVGIQYDDVNRIMERAEFLLITSEFDESERLLDTLNLKDIDEMSILLRYYYLRGFVMVFKNYPITEVLFNFDQILFGELDEEGELFRLLAYTGIGMVFAREDDVDKAEFYFNKVLENIYRYPIKDVEDTWRVLNIVYQSGEFYACINELDVSNVLLEYAITICSDNHVTYYLARAAFQLAKNAIQQEKPKEYILELIHDARAFAKINRNYIKLEKLTELEKVVQSDH